MPALCRGSCCLKSLGWHQFQLLAVISSQLPFKYVPVNPRRLNAAPIFRFRAVDQMADRINFQWPVNGAVDDQLASVSARYYSAARKAALAPSRCQLV